VKVQLKLPDIALPAVSLAPTVIVAVYVVLFARFAVGSKVAVLPEYVTEPATGADPGPVTRNVALLIELGSIASLNVAVTLLLRATLLAPLAGLVETTVGAVVSVAVFVVKVQVKLFANELPAASLAPVVIVAV